MVSLLSFHQPLLALDFPSVASLPLSTFIELKRVGALLCIRLWLKGMLWLVQSYIQNTKIFSISVTGLFHFLIICVLTGVALLISFKNSSFAFATWLIGTGDLALGLSQLLRCLPH